MSSYQHWMHGERGESLRRLYHALTARRIPYMRGFWTPGGEHGYARSHLVYHHPTQFSDNTHTGWHYLTVAVNDLRDGTGPHDAGLPATPDTHTALGFDQICSASGPFKEYCVISSVVTWTLRVDTGGKTVFWFVEPLFNGYSRRYDPGTFGTTQSQITLLKEDPEVKWGVLGPSENGKRTVRITVPYDQFTYLRETPGNLEDFHDYNQGPGSTARFRSRFAYCTLDGTTIASNAVTLDCKIKFNVQFFDQVAPTQS